MIGQDVISKMLSILGIMIALYLSTFKLEALILFPIILLISGITMQYFILRRVEDDPDLDRGEAKDIMFYTIIGMAGFAIASFVSPMIKIPTYAVALSGVNASLYSILMAIAEEQFFRGFLANFLMEKGFFVGVVGSAMIFTVYHLAVYGTAMSALMFVLIGGMILAWVGERSGRLSVPMIAHMINNLISTVGWP